MDADLAARMHDLEARVGAAGARWGAHDPAPDDPFRGLYVADEHVDEMLVQGAARLQAENADHRPEPSSADSVLGALAADFELSPLDLEILVVAVAPDLDPRFEKLYGYLHDDITRRRASIGLSLELAGLVPTEARARARFDASAPLRRGGLIVIEDADRPFLTRGLRLPDRVASHLLGDATVDAGLLDVLVSAASRITAITPRLVRSVTGRAALVYLRERTNVGAPGLAVGAMVEAGMPEPLCLELSRVHPADHRAVVDEAIREARLSGRGIVIVDGDDLDVSVVRRLSAAPIRVVLVGTAIWDPDRSDETALAIDLDPMTVSEQAELWLRFLDETGADGVEPPDAFRLGPEQIGRAVDAGAAAAEADDEHLDTPHLAIGARTQNSAGLERLARRIVPSAGWDDIVLDASTTQQLDHLVSRVANRGRVLDDWGLRRGGGRGEGVTALFAGDSGTGKTLAAEVIARALDLELYVIDLSTVVDKYVGETEKNLEKIFTEAEGVNAVLFFDEADALFGKRSEVSDARDRYANVEVAYLLQRMETFDGLGILATNLKANVDEAFARRLSVVVDFPDPDATLRRNLWETLVGDVPLSDDVDLGFCAERFELSGGNIRNIAVTAAYMAATNGQQVHMHDLIRATQVEYRKLGRLCVEREFGPYFDLVRSTKN